MWSPILDGPANHRLLTKQTTSPVIILCVQILVKKRNLTETIDRGGVLIHQATGFILVTRLAPINPGKANHV